MKTLLKVFVLSLAVGLSSCGNNNSADHHEHEGHDHKSETVLPSTGKFGAEISVENALDVPTAIAQISEDTTTNLRVKGTILEVCQHSGCWITMDMGDGEALMVNMLDHAYAVPKDAVGKQVWVEGMAVRELIPVDMLKHYAEDAGRSQEEIDAITEPEWTYTIDAAGVVIQ
jgi:hypothetical protein